MTRSSTNRKLIILDLDAGDAFVVGDAGLERGGGGQVVSPLELHVQPRLGPDQVRVEVVVKVLVQLESGLGDCRDWNAKGREQTVARRSQRHADHTPLVFLGFVDKYTKRIFLDKITWFSLFIHVSGLSCKSLTA